MFSLLITFIYCKNCKKKTAKLNIYHIISIYYITTKFYFSLNLLQYCSFNHYEVLLNLLYLVVIISCYQNISNYLKKIVSSYSTSLICISCIHNGNASNKASKLRRSKYFFKLVKI